MKIGIIDPKHYFCIYTLVSIYGTGENEIIIFTTSNIHSKCLHDLGDRKDITYIVQQEDESWTGFLSRNVSVINNLDLDYFYFMPIYENYKEHYQFVSKLNTINILVVFNLKGWIKPSFLKWRWIKESWYKRKIISKMQWIAIDEHFHDYCLKRGCKNKILHLPVLLYDPSKNVSKGSGKKLKIIFPGSLDNTRRDYSMVFDTVDKLLETTTGFEVVLLGYPIGEFGLQLQKKAESINKKHNEKIYVYYQTGYDENEYVGQMTNGDILVTSILPTYTLDGIQEYYGVSKSTGSCFDILAYAIPGIFPDWLSINPNFDSSTLRFKNETDLAETLKKFIKDPEILKELKENAKQNSQPYSVEEIRKAVYKTLSENKST